MAILAINFTAARRQNLGNVLFIIHLICAACGLAFFGLGIYIKIRLSAWMQLVDGYNDNLLPLMMVIVGTLLVVVDISGGRLVKSVESTSRLRHLLIPYLVIAFILSLCILTAGSICFVHRKNLSAAFHRGLTHAMQRYQDNSTFKTKFDNVQIEFECCGNLGYEDWFDIQWVNNKYIDLKDPEVESKMTNGRFLNDDVPFSCCDPGIARHCIHHHIHDNDMHYNYDYRTDLTIFPEGCKAKLISYYSFRLSNVGAIVMAMFVMQVGIIIGLRYLQTAVHNSQKDPDGDSKGWLFKRLPTKETKADGREDRDVESGDAEGAEEESASQSGSAASAQSDSGSEPYEDSFESDGFKSDDRADVPVQGKVATQASPQQVPMDEPAYANLPFHQDKERLQETLQDAKEHFQDGKETKKTEKQSTSKESKKSSTKQDSSKKDSAKKDSKKDSPKKDSKKDSPKKDSKKDSPKKDSKKDSPKKDSKKSGSSKKTSPKKDSKVSKSPKKEKKAKSPKKTSPKSKKQSPTKKKTPSPSRKSKSVKKSPAKKKASPKKAKSIKSKSPKKSSMKSKSMKKKSPKSSMKSKSMKKKSPKSGGSMKKSKKKMKNRNNNIEDSSDYSSDESDISDTAPLLGKFYSSSEEEELCRDPVNSGVVLRPSAFHKPHHNFNNNEGSPEVTWLLSRTQFYSSPQTFAKYNL